MKHPFMYATQYYRDPTPLEVEWEEDLERIKGLNIDTVQLRLNWRYYETKENEYNFNKVDRLLEVCVKHNIKVIIKFMLECAPQYVFEKYNGTRVNHDGSYIRPGSHGAFYGGWRPCFTNPKVMERAELFVSKLTEHIYKHDCIVLYNVWNEIRNRPLGECFCEECRKAFGNYLKDKFGTIEKLNDFYGTAEESFETINLPATPHGYWDLYEFKKFKGGVELKNWLLKIKNACRSVDKERQIMAHVGICEAFQHDLEDVSEDAITREAVDFFGTSVPCDTTMDTPEKRLDYLMLNDYMRAVDPNYVIHEIYPGLGCFKYPYDSQFDMDFKLYAALASGVKGMTFWQYRAERLGCENDCAGLANMDGTYRDICENVRNVGELINKDKSLFENAYKKHAEIAIVYDFDSQLLSEIEDICGVDFKFNDWGAVKYYRYAHEGMYRLLTKSNIDVDYVLSKDLDKLNQYKVLYFPYYTMLTDEMAKALEQFVSNGGVAILDEGFAMRDPNTWMNPYNLKTNLFTLRYNKRRRMYGNETININGEEVPYAPYKQTYRFNDGEALLTFKDGEKALTKYNYGKGTVYLAGFPIGFTYHSTNSEALKNYVLDLLNNYNIKKNESNFEKGLLIRSIEGPNYQLKFYFNVSDENVKMPLDTSNLKDISGDISVNNSVLSIAPKKMGYIVFNK